MDKKMVLFFFGAACFALAAASFFLALVFLAQP